MSKYETKSARPTAIIISVAKKGSNDEITKEYLDELQFLASTINIDVKQRFTQKLEHPDKKT